MGAYLSARFAQNQFDWARARDFLKIMEEGKEQKSPLLAKRLMLLSMATGDLETARAYARFLSDSQDDTGLSHLLDFVVAIKDEKWDVAEQVLNRSDPGIKSKNPIFEFARPLLMAWMTARTKTLSRVALMGVPSPHQRVLLAGYLDQVTTLIDPVSARAWASKTISLNAQEIGDIFMEARQFDLATLYYEQSERQTGASDDLKVRLAAARRGELPSGLILARAPATITQGIASVFFDLAANFYIENSIESAQLFANLALALYPDFVSARLMLGHLYAQNDRTDQAIEMFKTIPDSSSRFSGVQRQIANLYVEQGNKDAAIDILTREISRSGPEAKIDLMVQIGDIYRDSEIYNDALLWYDKAMADIEKIGRKPDAELLFARGTILERLKKWPEAEIELKAALALAPQHPYIMNYLGYSWADQGVHLDHALDLLEKASEQVPDDGAVTDSLGWALYRMERYDEAASVLEQATQLVPYDSTINDHLGDAYWKSGRRREARFQWQRAENYAQDDKDKEKIRSKIANGLR